MAGLENNTRYWMGKLDTTKVDHVFDADSKYPSLACCGTANLDNCTEIVEYSEAKTDVDLMIRTSPAHMCGRCRMVIVFKIWKGLRDGKDV